MDMGKVQNCLQCGQEMEVQKWRDIEGQIVIYLCPSGHGEVVA